MVVRSPSFSIGGLTVQTLGDTHLGRKFINNVPLDRRGEREEMIWKQFEKEINDVKGVDIHIHMGDLFDKFVVSPETVLRAVDSYRLAAGKHPGTRYFILRGNHDCSRDLDRASSFDIFHRLCVGMKNVTVVSDGYLHNLGKDKAIAFFPCDAFQDSKQMVEPVLDRLVEKDWDLLAAFGHWDIDTFGDHEPHNLVPASLLVEHTPLIVTGHIHKPTERWYDKDGRCAEQVATTRLVVTGSMQPYAFGEQLEDEMYITLPLADYLADPDLYTNSVIRMVVPEGEEVPENINCLGLQIVREAAEAEEVAVEDVEIEEFDLSKLFKAAMDEAGVPDAVRTEAWGKYEELKDVE